VAALLVLAQLLVSKIPLVNALIRLLSDGRPAVTVLPQVSIIGAIGVAVLAAGLPAVHAIHRRH